MPDPFKKLEATRKAAEATIHDHQDKCDNFVSDSSLDPDTYNPDWSAIIAAAESAGLSKAVEILDDDECQTIPNTHVAQVLDSEVIIKCRDDVEGTLVEWGIPEELFDTLSSYVEYQRDMVAAAINVYADAINAGLFQQTKPAKTNTASDSNSDWDNLMQSFHSDAYIKESE